jgi:GT2 family glycosyltransferase
MPADPPPFVSVVVPTADRCAVVVGCLEHLLRQEDPGVGHEVIVVDDGSRDDTPAAVRNLEASRADQVLRYVRRPRSGAAAARNAGLEVARGELICFLDDDALAPPRWLAELVAGADRHPDAGLFGGPVRPCLEHRPPHTCPSHELAGMRLDHGPADTDVDEVWGCNMALRRSAVRATGPFDERLSVAEDWDWGHRLRAAGGRIVYLPDAWVVHRRLASDLNVSRLVVEYYRRGYVVGARDGSRETRGAPRAAIDGLRHCARARCTRGLTDASRSLGLWSGGLARRSRLAWHPGRGR